MGAFTNLMYHKKNTHRVIKFKCNLCTEEFVNKSNLNCHVNSSHKELTPYSCPRCYKGFARKDNMKRHLATECVGQKTSQKKVKVPETCKFCKKQFFDISTLKRHSKNIHNCSYDCQWQNWQYLLQNAEDWTTWWKVVCHLEPTT